MKLDLPLPLPGQLQIIRSGARHKVVICGRRWGKTSCGVNCISVGHGPKRKDGRPLFKGIIHGAHGVWAPPTFGHVAEVWRELKTRLADITVDKSEKEYRLEVRNGGSIMVRSGEAPDSFRGFKFDFAFIDEVSLHVPEIWSQALAPALSDSRGWAIFSGTPKGPDNWSYDLFQRASHLKGWERWQRPSSDNPLMTPEEMNLRKLEVGTYAFRREYLAEFVSPTAGFFKAEWFHGATFHKQDKNERVVIDTIGIPIPLHAMDIFCTVDLATTTKTTSDYTVFMVFGITRERQLIVLDVVRKKLEAPEIIPLLSKTVKKWNVRTTFIESVAFQQAMVQFAKRDGLNVVAVRPDKDKVSRAEVPAALMEGKKMFFVKDTPWYADLESEFLNFPDKQTHDDVVDCGSLAAWVYKQHRASVGPVVDFRAQKIDREGLREEIEDILRKRNKGLFGDLEPENRNDIFGH